MDFKYKVGDRVRILDGSNIEDYTAKWAFGMVDYIGKIATIENAFTHKGKNAYHLCHYAYVWDERGLAPAPASPLVCNTEIFVPLRIVRNGIATIVFWNDGTKTIVKRGEDEEDSEYSAFTAALAIKLYGSNSAVKRIVAETKEQKKQRPKKKA